MAVDVHDMQPSRLNHVVWHYETGRAGEVRYISANRQKLAIFFFVDVVEEWESLPAFTHAPLDLHSALRGKKVFRRECLSLVDWTVPAMQLHDMQHITTMAATLTAC